MTTMFSSAPGAAEDWDAEPDLDTLLADAIMEPILRSARTDRDQLRHQLATIALRIRDSG